MKYLAGICITLAVFAVGSPAHAAATPPLCSSIEECQAKYNELEQQAAAKRAIIATTQDQANTLKNEIAALQNQIGAVQAEISATGAKMNQTQLEIGTVQDQIGQKRIDIIAKQDTIGRLVFFRDQIDRLDPVADLFKYESLSDFLSQLHDAENMQSRLIDVIGQLQDAKNALEQDEATLEGKQQQLQQLSDQAAQRKQQLASVKGERARVLTVTKGQEAAYQKELVSIEEQKTAFFVQLQQFEQYVISGGLYIVHITATNVPPKGTKLFIKPESNPRLTQGYGCTSYARCGRKSGPYGGSPHNGVDYASGFGTPILAIGDGTIAANGTNDGWGNWVAIQHPNNMVSLYAHMASLSPLKVGSAVTQGQIIGYEGHTGAATGSHVHLSIYKDFFTYVKDKNGQLYFNYFEGTVNPLNYL
jgi:murein DD-endopeptidase MepM/ murein hydrolase activator NlpD